MKDRARTAMVEARMGLSVLNRLVDERPEEYFQPMTEAVRKLVSARDDLIHRCRERRPDICLGNALRDMNAVVSVAIGAQFPVVGIKRERIEHTRDGLKQWIERYKEAL